MCFLKSTLIKATIVAASVCRLVASVASGLLGSPRLAAVAVAAALQINFQICRNL